MNDSTLTLLVNIQSVLNFVCEIIVLALPWMILGAIKAVKKSVDEASNRRNYEAQKLLRAIEVLHNDLVNATQG